MDPLPIDNDLERGEPNVPRRINRSSPTELFELLFTDKWLDNVAERTNANAERRCRAWDNQLRHWNGESPCPTCIGRGQQCKPQGQLIMVSTATTGVSTNHQAGGRQGTVAIEKGWTG